MTSQPLVPVSPLPVWWCPHWEGPCPSGTVSQNELSPLWAVYIIVSYDNNEKARHIYDIHIYKHTYTHRLTHSTTRKINNLSPRIGKRFETAPHSKQYVDNSNMKMSNIVKEIEIKLMVEIEIKTIRLTSVIMTLPRIQTEKLQQCNLQSTAKT